MQRFIFLFFFLMGCFSAQAQFTDSTPHYIRLSALGNLNRSNSTTSYLFTNEARYSVKNKHTTLNTIANWTYGEQEANLTNNDFTATADFNFYRDSSKLYYWALANYTTSYSLQINNQLQSGLGAAYNVVNTANNWLNVSEGILYETSSLSTADAAANQYHTFRNSLRLSYKFTIKKTIIINGANYLQQALGNASDYIVRMSNSVGIKLNRWVTFATTITYNQYTRTGSENFMFTYGITAEKFF